MPVAGIDVGAVATKSVILEDGKLLAYSIVPTGVNGGKTANYALNDSLVKAGLHLKNLEFIISTGYGRRNVDVANKVITEITAHAKGAKRLFPRTRTIIDVGGQDSKVISLNEDGRIINFIMNDKCAAGTGKFLEIMAKTLEINLMDLGELSTHTTCPAEISSMCTVFAESEVISLLTQGRRKEDIAAGLHESISKRLVGNAKQVGVRKEVVFTGGVAKNMGMRISLEKELGFKTMVPEEPQITGALGAAIMAEEHI